MFICNKCLEEHFQNSQSYSRSEGQCEYCMLPSDCNVIPTIHLVKKELTDPATGEIIKEDK